MASRLSRTRFTCLPLVALLVWACGGTDQSAPVPASLSVVSGDGQSAVVGSLLGTSLTVRVLDDMGDPVAGFTVSWSVASGGGSVGQASTTTAANGQASTDWTLGGSAGSQSVTASGGGFSATFSATGEAGDASQIAVTAGASTLDALGATTQLTGQLQDAFGNALAGDVAWSSGDDAIVTVDESGLATAVANGEADVTATSGAISGSATLTVAQAAATVTITPANPVTSIGGTVQLSASVEDANANPMAGATITWSSGTQSTATVDGDGVVTGVAEGQADVTATSGDASSTVSVTVTAAPFEPTSDVTITGDLSAATINIPAGVTATLTGDANLSSAGDITIAGTLTGDCVALGIAAGGALAMTGDVSVACSDTTATPTDLTLTAGGAMDLDGVNLTANGDITVSNEAASGVGTPLGSGPSGVAAQIGACSHRNVRIESEQTVGFAAAGEPIGEDGLPGSNVTIRCSGALTISGGKFTPSPGQPGGTGESYDGSTAFGGDGGAGGSVVIVAPTIDFRTDAGEPVRIVISRGGTGGGAYAQSSDARAIGGDGGAAGLPVIVGAVNILAGQTIEISSRTSSLYGEVGGRGGWAEAVADPGAHATSTEAAKPGGNAVASGGAGGNVGFATTTNLIGALFPEGTVNPSAIYYILENAKAGSGGQASAGGGIGGSGSEQFKDGADAGDSQANGGKGGDVTLFDNRSGLFVGVAGNGGPIIMGLEDEQEEVGSIDRPSGSGGMGWSDCRVGNLVPGGSGGRGSIGRGTRGPGGMKGSAVGGTVGGLTVIQWGNGGHGGNGAGPGTGGQAGDLNAITPSGTPIVDAYSLMPGSPGSDCITGIAPVVSVADDKNGHAPFIALAPTNLSVELGSNGSVTISGNGNWITVTGTVEADGTFQATGSGMAAGYSGVQVTFNGKFSIDSEGRVTGIESGTLTMDSNNNVFPPNTSDVRNPAVYSVTGSLPGGGG